MRNVKLQNKARQQPTGGRFNKWGKRIVGAALAVALGTVAYEGVKGLAQSKAAKQEGKQKPEFSRAVTNANRNGVRASNTNATQQVKSFTNNIPRLKAVYAKRVKLNPTQQKAFDSIGSIAQKTGFGAGRILQNIIIYQKEFSNPNYQRATVREKQEMLGTGDMRVISIGNAFAQLSQPERAGIRSLLAVKGVKEEVWGIAGEERLRANQEAMGFK
jgi:hypothetical protein